MSVFDVNNFLSTPVEASFDTKFTPIPAGEYMAVIGSGEKDLQVKAIPSKTGGPSSISMELYWTILDDKLKHELNLENPRVRQQMWLDIDESTGKLLTGTNNNTKLGAVRDAVGQNGTGPWSPLMLKGQGPAKIRVVQTPDGKDPTIKYSEVVAVARVS